MSAMETGPVVLRRRMQDMSASSRPSAAQSEVMPALAAGMKIATGHMPSWKRRLDLFCILLTSPAWICVGLGCALWVKLISRGPVFFKQERIGLDGKKFTILKFRSMKHGAETDVHHNHVNEVFEDGPMIKMDATDDRLLRGGRLLRDCGLDELPQILNVIRGEMSLVGPRPCTPNELGKYNAPMMARFDTLPGITGNWQVNGKNNTTFQEMVRLDLEYVQTRSLGKDLKILLRTIPALLQQMIDHRSQRRQRPEAKPI